MLLICICYWYHLCKSRLPSSAVCSQCSCREIIFHTTLTIRSSASWTPYFDHREFPYVDFWNSCWKAIGIPIIMLSTCVHIRMLCWHKRGVGCQSLYLYFSVFRSSQLPGGHLLIRILSIGTWWATRSGRTWRGRHRVSSMSGMPPPLVPKQDMR